MLGRMTRGRRPDGGREVLPRSRCRKQRGRADADGEIGVREALAQRRLGGCRAVLRQRREDRSPWRRRSGPARRPATRRTRAASPPAGFSSPNSVAAAARTTGSSCVNHSSRTRSTSGAFSDRSDDSTLGITRRSSSFSMAVRRGRAAAGSRLDSVEASAARTLQCAIGIQPRQHEDQALRIDLAEAAKRCGTHGWRRVRDQVDDQIGSRHRLHATRGRHRLDQEQRVEVARLQQLDDDRGGAAIGNLGDRSERRRRRVRICLPVLGQRRQDIDRGRVLQRAQPLCGEAARHAALAASERDELVDRTMVLRSLECGGDRPPRDGRPAGRVEGRGGERVVGLEAAQGQDPQAERLDGRRVRFFHVVGRDPGERAALHLRGNQAPNRRRARRVAEERQGFCRTALDDRRRRRSTRRAARRSPPSCRAAPARRPPSGGPRPRCPRRARPPAASRRRQGRRGRWPGRRAAADARRYPTAAARGRPREAAAGARRVLSSPAAAEAAAPDRGGPAGPPGEGPTTSSGRTR